MRLLLKTVVYALAFAYDYCLRAVGFVQYPEVSILMYHAVESSGWRLSVLPKQFERQMLYLASRYTVVPLSDIVAYAEGNKKLSSHTIAITIDDGYEDTYTTAFPILRKYNLPFTVFLTTDLRASSKLANLPRLTWDQIREMQESGLATFEVHGHVHENLNSIADNVAALDAEILGSRAAILERIGKHSVYLAYASGYKNDTVIAYIKKQGFKAGFTINEGFVQTGDDPFLLRRTQIDGTMNFWQFKLRLTGAIEQNRRWVDAVRTHI